MSLLDSVFGKSENSNSPIHVVGALIEHGGGLETILAKFNSAGLTETVHSWIATGKNLPLSAEQLESALGGDVLKRVADKLGTDVSTITSHLTKYLPEVVDKLSPDGKLTDTLTASTGFIGVVKSVFSKKEDPNEQTH